MRDRLHCACELCTQPHTGGSTAGWGIVSTSRVNGLGQKVGRARRWPVAREKVISWQNGRLPKKPDFGLSATGNWPLATARVNPEG